MKNKSAIYRAGLAIGFLVLVFSLQFGERATVRAESPALTGKFVITTGKVLRANESVTSQDLGLPRTLTLCFRGSSADLVEGAISGSVYYPLAIFGGGGTLNYCASVAPVSRIRIERSADASVPVVAEVQATY
ncbi:MAG TPA: hypothetical protein VIH89_18850 [Candidatus Sulfotelmatobacter sp.]